MDYKDAWKNTNIFKKQLSLNKEQFNNYPSHWNSFINLIKIIDNQKIKINLLDIGCGCGSYYKLCNDNFLNISYFGIDYAEEAISLAINEWKSPVFQTMDIFHIPSDFIDQFNVVHLGALLDVLPNGNEALELILNKQIPYIIIGRIDFTTDSSGSYTYTAYNEITTYKYKHNVDDFKNIVNKFNYKIIAVDSSSILLHYEKDSNNTGNNGARWIVSN